MTDRLTDGFKRKFRKRCGPLCKSITHGTASTPSTSKRRAKGRERVTETSDDAFGRVRTRSVRFVDCVAFDFDVDVARRRHSAPDGRTAGSKENVRDDDGNDARDDDEDDDRDGWSWSSRADADGNGNGHDDVSTPTTPREC